MKKLMLLCGVFLFSGAFSLSVIASNAPAGLTHSIECSDAGDFRAEAHPDKCGAERRGVQYETEQETIDYLKVFEPELYALRVADQERKEFEARSIAWKKINDVFHPMENVKDPIDWRLSARGINENIKTEAGVFVDWWFGADFGEIRRNSKIAHVQRNYKHPDWVLFAKGLSMHNPGAVMVAGNASVTPLPPPAGAGEKLPFWRRDNIYAYGTSIAGVVAGGLVTDWYGLAKDDEKAPAPQTGGTLTNGDQSIQLPESAFGESFFIEQTETGQSFDNRPREEETTTEEE